MQNSSKLWREVATGLDPSVMNNEINSGMNSFKIICEINGELCQGVKVRYRRRKCHCVLMNDSNTVKRRKCIRRLLKIALSLLCFIFVFDMLIVMCCIFFAILPILPLTKFPDPASHITTMNFTIFFLTLHIKIVLAVILIYWMQNALYTMLIIPFVAISVLTFVVHHNYRNDSGLERLECGQSCSWQFIKYFIPLNIFRNLWNNKYF